MPSATSILVDVTSGIISCAPSVKLPVTESVVAISTAPSMSTASKLVVPSTSKSPLKSTLPATARVVAMSTAPSMSTTSRLAVPSTSMFPDISRDPACNAPSVTDMFPVADPVAVVVPNTNVSALSSHIKIALSPVEPRSITIPLSLELDDAPLFSSIRLSDTTMLVVLTVVVSPLTVKSPEIVTLSAKTTSSVPVGTRITIVSASFLIVTSFVEP